MQQLYGDFMKIKEKESIKMKNSLFNQIVNSYNFEMITNETNYIKIDQIKNKIKIITIDIVPVLNNNYLVFCFNQNLFVINLTEFNLIKHYFANNKDSDIFILNANTPNSFLENFDQYSKIHIEQKGSYFQTEINDFCNDFNTIEKIKFWNLIKRCLSGYLIKQSYFNTFIDRVFNCKELFKESKEEKLSRNDYVELENIGLGSSSIIKLIFIIEKQKLYVLKQIEDDHLFEREHDNYIQNHHPFLLQYLGISEESHNGLILEYVNGHSLDQGNEIQHQRKN